MVDKIELTLPNRKTVTAKKTKKKQKKSANKVLNNTELVVARPSMSKNPQTRVAKNTVSVARGLEGGLVESIERILLSVSAPREYPPVRLGAAYGSYQTALANPFKVRDATWQTVLTDSSTNSFGFLFRDPRCNFITPVTNTGAGTSYSCSYQQTPIVTGLQAVPLELRPMAWNTIGSPVHGNTFFPGKLPGNSRTYLWAQNGSTITFTNPGAVNLGFRTFCYNSVEMINQLAGQTVGPGATGTFNCVEDGYYGLDVSAAAEGTTWQGIVTVNYPNPGNTFVWGHFCMADYDLNQLAAHSIKMYATSVMFTNEASPLNRQGKIAAAQIPNGTDWRNLVQYDKIASVKDAYTIDAVNGYYGFLKPTQPQDVDFIRGVEIDGSLVVKAYFDLSRPSDFLAVCVKVATPEGRDGYWTYSSAIEYRTDDQWRSVDFPKIGSDVVQKSMTLLARLPQHHENPFHMSDLLDWVTDAAESVYNGFKNALPKIVDGALTVGKIGAAILPFL